MSPDVPAGNWLTQQWATAFYLPTYVGQSFVPPLYGLFLGRFCAHLADGELWKEHTKWYRAFLYGIATLLTVYTLLVAEEACYWGALQKRSMESILNGHAVDVAIPLLGGLISALVSSALAYRASHLFTSRPSRWTFLGVVGSIILCSVTGSLLVAYNASLLLQDDESSTSFTFNNSITLWTSTAAAADVVISLALWFNLRRRLGEGFEASDSILRTLARVGLKTAGYTTIVALVAAALSAFPQDDYRTVSAVYAAFLPLPCLSCLSLFTTLHSQRTVRDRKVALSLAGNLESIIAPVSFSDPLPSDRRGSQVSQIWESGQGLDARDKEAWKPDEARREEGSVLSRDSEDTESDQSPV